MAVCDLRSCWLRRRLRRLWRRLAGVDLLTRHTAVLHLQVGLEVLRTRLGHRVQSPHQLEALPPTGALPVDVVGDVGVTLARQTVLVSDAASRPHAAVQRLTYQQHLALAAASVERFRRTVFYKSEQTERLDKRDAIA